MLMRYISLTKRAADIRAILRPANADKCKEFTPAYILMWCFRGYCHYFSVRHIRVSLWHDECYAESCNARVRKMTFTAALATLVADIRHSTLPATGLRTRRKEAL